MASARHQEQGSFRPWSDALWCRWACAGLLVCLVGCQGSQWLRPRRSPSTPLADPLKLFSWSGPEPTPRTKQWLRRYDLVGSFESGDLTDLIRRANEVVANRKSSENVYVMAELAFLAGKSAEHTEDAPLALDMYGVAVANAYMYLLDENFDLGRNPYDPQFRLACDVYNGSLESVMRLAQKDGPLRPGTRRLLETANQAIELSVVSRGSWRSDQIERLEFVSDYNVKGLTNHYRSFGLGVPLIAVMRSDRDAAGEQFHAPGMSVPATALLRVIPERTCVEGGKSKHFCVVELHDPLVASDVRVADRWVPLETDLSTPLAYSLSDPLFQRTEIGTRGLLDPTSSQSVQGIYLLEPFDPRKVPVLMVHGLGSSLITWMEMFNDLRGDSEIRDHYQFWFYLYPTGQPFWTTAAQLRRGLIEARAVLDPHGRAPALDSMVLVGHSMGGLIAKLQTLESRDDYWALISNQPLGDVQGAPDLVSRLRETWFFEPNPSIRRVVMIGSPHRGSEFSNGTTQWLARHLIRLPKSLGVSMQRLLSENAELQTSPLLRVNNSVESLSPDSPVLSLMLQSIRPNWVKYHNIVGVLSEDEVLGRVTAYGDGVVKFESAHLDDAESEAVVPEDHLNIHRHPRAVLEVQRILLEHLAELRGQPVSLQVAGDMLVPARR